MVKAKEPQLDSQLDFYSIEGFFAKKVRKKGNSEIQDAPDINIADLVKRVCVEVMMEFAIENPLHEAKGMLRSRLANGYDVFLSDYSLHQYVSGIQLPFDYFGLLNQKRARFAA